MSLIAFSGPAGVGKTFRLLAELERAIANQPLSEGQRVLALTFMHGSRRRLHSRLLEMRSLRGRFECTTIDRFAWELCVRWRTLRRHLCMRDFAENEYDATCDAAGSLLEHAEVAEWVARGFPFVVVDEAQDLTPERLRIVRALETVVTMLAATDEYQCLNERLRPNPTVQWMAERTNIQVLEFPRRTSVPALLSAANAIRRGEDVGAGSPSLTIVPAPGRGARAFELAATYLANAIRWNGGNEIAVITSSKKGFAPGVLARVAAGPVGRQGNGPYTISWEMSEDEGVAALVERIKLPEGGDSESMLAALSGALNDPAAQMCSRWIRHQRSIGSANSFTADSIKDRLGKCVAQHRRHAWDGGTRLRAMTVHQAKNREFDGVVVIWPYTVAGPADQRRRLLYNAVTRAKHWCVIIAQSRQILDQPPFAAGP
jgi:hypothetical protein